MLRSLIPTVVVAVAASSPADAHHSMAMFDAAKGSLIDVKKAAGTVLSLRGSR